MEGETRMELGKLAFIGCGKMGESCLSGLLSAGFAAPENISVLEHTAEKCAAIEKRYGVACSTEPSKVLPADTVLIAVKPQVARGLVEQLAKDGLLDGSLAVSIAAGISTSTFEAMLPKGCAVVRVMPNTPLMVGQGMSAVSAGASASPAQASLVQDMFGALGSAVSIPESLQDAACALNGSGPAYFARMAGVLAAAGEKQGLPAEVALKLSVQTMLGTAVLLRDGSMSPEELVKAVSSPGGTTVAALSAMEDAGFDNAIEAGVEACVRRSKELG